MPPPPSEPPPPPHTIEGLKYHSENKIFISMKKMPLFSSIIKKCESHNKTSTSTIFKYATGLVLFQNRHNIQYIAFLGIYSSVLYSLKGSIENRFFKFFAHIFFLNAIFKNFYVIYDDKIYIGHLKTNLLK